MALIEAISARSAAARDCSAMTLDWRSTFIAWSEDQAGLGVPPASAFGPLAWVRSEAICRLSATTSGWVSVSPRPCSAGEVGFGLGERGARAAGAGGDQRARRAGELAVDRGERALRGGEVGLDAAQLGAGRGELARDAGGAADQLGMLGLERQAALLGFLELALALGELLVEELDRLAHLAAAAAEVGLAGDVDQPQRDVLRQLGVLAVGEVAAAAVDGDREDVLLVADQLDVLAERSDRPLHLARAGDRLADPGRADDLLEVGGADQGLAHPLDVLLARVGADADLVGEHVVELDEHARLGFVAVGDQRDREPAEQAHAPGHRQRQPAAVPDGPQRRAQLLR